MARKDFDEQASYHGGRVNPDEGTKPRKRYPCFANGCPMPGTIFGEAGSQGQCAWHYKALPNDIPRITAALREWECVSYEVNEARRAFNGEAAADPGALAVLFRNAQERLQPLAGDHWAKLQPKDGESYHRWAQKLEAFVGGQVRDVLSMRRHGVAA